MAEWLWRGQTVGKRLLGLRVVDADGLRLEPSQVIVRNLMRLHRRAAGAVSGGRHRLCGQPASAAAGRSGGGNRGDAHSEAGREPDLDQLLGSKYNSLAGASASGGAPAPEGHAGGGANLALEALLRRDQFDPAARLAGFPELGGAFSAPWSRIRRKSSNNSPMKPYVRDVVGDPLSAGEASSALQQGQALQQDRPLCSRVLCSLLTPPGLCFT